MVIITSCGPLPSPDITIANAGAKDHYDRYRPVIVFVAHNAGAVLVEQVLLLASEDYRHQWISHSTVALVSRRLPSCFPPGTRNQLTAPKYLIESPSYTNHCGWEQCPVRLNATDRMRLEMLSALLKVPPHALAHVEVQFSAIRHAYDVTTSFKPLDMPPGVPFRSVSMRDAGWAQAIRNMAAEKAARIVEVRPVWEGQEDNIAKKVCSGDGYTYLCVMLSLEMLEHSKIPSTEDALRQQLMTPILPIEKVFDTLVSGLHESEPARLAISWIYHAARPLTVRELAVALALRADLLGEPGNAQRLTFGILAGAVSWDLLRDLGGILGAAIKVADDRVFLAHSTLRDYLKEHSNIFFPDFHATIAGRRPSAGTATPYGVASALLEYAELYWMSHFKLAPSLSQSPDGKATQSLALSVDTSGVADRKPSGAWDVSGTPETWLIRCGQAFGWKEDVIDDPLLLAAQFELGRIVDKLLAENPTPIAPERVGKAASIAARTGNVAIIHALLEVADSSSALLAALKAAAEYGHADVVEQLMARVDAADAVSLRSTRDANSPLLLAASNGHTEVVRLLLAQGLSMQTSDSSGNGPVHLASACGDAGTLKVLQELGPDDFDKAVATGNRSGRYPIHLACEAGFVEALDLLLSSLTNDQLAQVTRVGVKAMNAVQLAAESGHAAVLKTFIMAGVDVVRGYTTVASTPLCLAAQNGHYDAIVCLVEELEKLVTSVGDSKATTTEPRGQEEPWRLSVEKGFEQAVKGGHAKIVRFLIPDPLRNAAKDSDLLLHAITWGHFDVVKTLVGAGISVKTERKYNPALDRAIFSNSPDIVRFVLNQGDDLQQQDRGDLTPLETAARSGHVGVFKDLLACEEKLRAPSDQPRRPPGALLLAIQSPLESKVKTEFVHFLLDNQWEAGAPEGFDYPLHSATTNGQDDIVELLLRRGADLNARDQLRRTALHLAVAGRRTSTVAILLHRANPNLVGREGLAPLHVATDEGAEIVVRALLGLDGENGSILAVGRAKADVELPGPEGWRALHYAHASPAITRCLLEADPVPRLDAVAKGRLTPLILAASRGLDDVVRQLLDAGAKPDELDSEGRTALHHVAGYTDGDHPDRAKSLLEYKADPNIGTNDQPTPLYAAIVSETKGVARGIGCRPTGTTVMRFP
ncbi:hypothetical protein MAPG_00952 [Magnaporthiopsis poae ATCC 64411]|uniref:Uncharacterized protein n=1 Tax=Magnaporthiopsis poae (strain ATCC 64411 / 73-15) TaxID=644358 RepID=A0A0C4DME6_MAGP6|nr:hypothetical protein MAPG_00952 [Magnaporthiopsis poae ATCC 64411]